MIYVIEDSESDIKVAELIKSGEINIRGLYETTTDAYMGEHIKYQMESKCLEYTEDFIHQSIDYIDQDEEGMFNDILDCISEYVKIIRETDK